VKASMLAALQNVRPSHLLDHGLWKTLGLEAAREVVEAGPPREAASLVPAALLVR